MQREREKDRKKRAATFETRLSFYNIAHTNQTSYLWIGYLLRQPCQLYARAALSHGRGKQKKKKVCNDSSELMRRKKKERITHASSRRLVTKLEVTAALIRPTATTVFSLAIYIYKYTAILRLSLYIHTACFAGYIYVLCRARMCLRLLMNNEIALYVQSFGHYTFSREFEIILEFPCIYTRDIYSENAIIVSGI